MRSITGAAIRTRPALRRTVHYGAHNGLIAWQLLAEHSANTGDESNDIYNPARQANIENYDAL